MRTGLLSSLAKAWFPKSRVGSFVLWFSFLFLYRVVVPAAWLTVVWKYSSWAEYVGASG